MERKTAPLTPPQDADFFVSGGTMPESALSYVERAADRQLLDALLDGKFCYVLNSRQMGKSSLCVRVKTLLEAKGVACAFVDLTRIGGQNLSAEQWYAGILGEIGRSIGLRTEFLVYWKEHVHESPMQRVFGALREVALVKKDGLVAVFIDEVDAARSLPFNADEFLTGIRECYNRRAHDPIYDRLTFCLLGAAVPSDLIRDARTTPFNIGERIYLKDFTRDEAAVLAKGLGKGRERLLDRIFFWTNGHPFLTQSLCTAVEHDASIRTDEGVDALVKRDLLEPKARETNINLADVSNRVLNGYADGDDVEKFRADILSAYSKSLRGGAELTDDESNRLTAVLKLSGLMRSDGNTLKVRNPIYKKVFGKEWIRENMPGQELRRQRKAFWIGVARTTAVATIIISVISYLAITNRSLKLAAEKVAREKSYEAYVSTMNVMPLIYGQNNLTKLRGLLSAHANDSSKGLEWFYWDRIAHQADQESLDFGIFANNATLSDGGEEFVLFAGGTLLFLDGHDGRVLREFPWKGDSNTVAMWTPGGKIALLVSPHDGTSLVRSSDGKVLASLPSTARPIFNKATISKDGNKIIAYTPDFRVVQFDLTSRHAVELAKGGFAYYSPDNGSIALMSFDKTPYVRFLNAETLAVKSELRLTDMMNNSSFLPSGRFIGVAGDRLITIETDTGKILSETKVSPNNSSVSYCEDKFVLIGAPNGHLTYVDMKTAKVMWDIKLSSSSLPTISTSSDGVYACVTARNREGYLMKIGPHEHQIIRTIPDTTRTIMLPDGSGYVAMYSSLQFYKLDASYPVVTAALHSGQYRLRQKDGDFLTENSDRFRLFEVVDGHITLRKYLKNVDSFAAASANFWLLRSKGSEVMLYDFLSQKTLLTFSSPPAPGQPVFESTGDQEAAICLDGHDIEFWDLSNQKKLGDIHWKATVTNMIFDRQSHRLMIVGDDNRCGLIEILTRKVQWLQPRSYAGHDSNILSVRFSRDGNQFVTASDDDTAALWNTATGARSLVFKGSGQSVKDADISPDNLRVATVSDDDKLRIWDAKTGLELSALGSVGSPAKLCAFSRDGKYIITGDDAGTIKIWPISARKNIGSLHDLQKNSG